MAEMRNTPEAERLEKLVREAARAKRTETDRWGLTPIEKGWLRGHAMNVRQWEDACQFGKLLVIEFELRETMKSKGVPVRMEGTYFTGRIHEGAVMDVPDPDPTVRPVRPEKIYVSQSYRKHEFVAFYPGRDLPPQRRTLVQAVLAVTVPFLIFVGIVAVLHFYGILG